MTEQRATYTTITPQSTIAHPGSRLEALVEALDAWAELSPETYQLRISGIHRELRCALEGETEPDTLLTYLMELE